MKKKVAFLISSLNTGGAQRAVSSVVTNFPKDWEIDLILNNEENIVYPYCGNIISLNIKEPKQRVSLVYQGKVFFKRLRMLRKLKRENEYQAVISFMESANIVNVLTGNKYCKTILSVRIRLSGAKNWRIVLVTKTLVKWLYNKADKVVALSEGVRQDLIENFGVKPDKTCTIYNCYSVEEIQERASQECRDVNIEIEEKELTVATMGRLTQQKGQWHLLRAFSEVLKEEKQAKLYILGQGDLKEYLQKMARELGIENNVVFCGFQENPFSIISQMKMFVFPSLYEGFGNALVEAMACGLPCIATDFQYGAREIFQQKLDLSMRGKEIEYLEYGVLIPLGSDKQNTADEDLETEEIMLKDAILKIWQDKELRKRYKEKSLEGAARFTAKETVEQWIEVILG